jgi:hypothetical protein
MGTAQAYSDRLDAQGYKKKDGEKSHTQLRQGAKVPALFIVEASSGFAEGR